MSFPSHMLVKLPEDVQVKFETLRMNLRVLLSEGLLVAFSGGVDSALFLWATEMERRIFGGRLGALTTVSASTPERD